MAKLDNSLWVLQQLHPICRPMFERLTADLEEAWRNEKTLTFFKPYEGLRSPIKQLELLNVRPALTHVVPWHSAHQYGMAVDFVAWKGDAWSFSEDHDYEFLRLAAENAGLTRPMVWDKSHIEWGGWLDLTKALAKLERPKGSPKK